MSSVVGRNCVRITRSPTGRVLCVLVTSGPGRPACPLDRCKIHYPLPRLARVSIRGLARRGLWTMDVWAGPRDCLIVTHIKGARTPGASR